MSSTASQPTSTARSAAPGPRPPRPQAVLEVMSTCLLSPHLLRLILGGEGYASLHRNEHTDAYVKLLLPPAGSGLTPPYDLEGLRRDAPELLPARRTYTVRRWDDEKGRLDIDVVLHGEGEDAGIAARWAAEAQPGDRIALMGAGGGYSPDPASPAHLLIGDHAALPAIAAALEAMPAQATGRALVQLDREEDRLELARPEGVRLEWVIGPREQLLERLRALDLGPVEDLQVFCHAERGLTKLLRRALVQEAGVPRANLSISAYWALGRVEDQFQAEKREDVGRIE